MKELLFLSEPLLRREPAGGGQTSRTAHSLTIARLHALRVAVLLRVPRYGSHVGHVVALRVGVRRVGRVARHVRRRRVVLWSRREARRIV